MCHNTDTCQSELLSSIGVKVSAVLVYVIIWLIELYIVFSVTAECYEHNIIHM